MGYEVVVVIQVGGDRDLNWFGDYGGIQQIIGYMFRLWGYLVSRVDSVFYLCNLFVVYQKVFGQLNEGCLGYERFWGVKVL